MGDPPASGHVRRRPAGPTPASLSPMAIERPHNSTVATSARQTRLDHLTNHRALPACILPEGFERGVPIKECDSCNGIYFNKHTASEQAALVLEMGLFLPTWPGIAGGKYSAVPDSFKGIDTKPTARTCRTRCWRSRASAARQRGQMPDAGGAQEVQQDDFPRLSPLRSAEADAEEDFAEPEDSPPSRSDEQASERPRVGAQQRAGVPRAAGRGQCDPSRRVRPRGAGRASTPPRLVPALPYEWDQLAHVLLDQDGRDAAQRRARRTCRRCAASTRRVRATRTRRDAGGPAADLAPLPGRGGHPKAPGDVGEEKTRSCMPLSVQRSP